MSQALKITAPKNTAQNSPVREVMSFPRCIIPTVGILFPRGHVGLTGLWIEYQGKQVLPQNFEHVFRGDDVYRVLKPNLPILEPPFELEVHLFNTDDTFEHSCYLDFDVILDSSSSFPSDFSIADLNTYFRNE